MAKLRLDLHFLQSVTNMQKISAASQCDTQYTKESKTVFFLETKATKMKLTSALTFPNSSVNN